MASVSLAQIAVHPVLTTTVDQKVDITVSKLSAEQNITLRARTIDDSKIVFESFAHYKADKNGEVLVSSQPSMGGSYAGVEPMGLFWSMKPLTTGDRDDLLRKRDVTTPLKVTLDVYYGHDQKEFAERDKKACVTLLRSYIPMLHRGKWILWDSVSTSWRWALSRYLTWFFFKKLSSAIPGESR